MYELLSDLAVQIGKSLKSLANEQSTTSPVQPPPEDEQEPAVYLGYTPKERRDERKRLAALLAERGVKLCPETPLSAFATIDELHAHIRNELDRSQLAVQLLADYNGTNELTTMQIDLATAGGVPVLLWRPESLGLASLDEDAFGYAAYRERFKDYVQSATTETIEAVADSIVGRLAEHSTGDLVDDIEPWHWDWPTILVFSGNTAGYRFVQNELEPRLEEVTDKSKWKVVYPGPEIHSPTALKRFYEDNIADCDAVIVVRCEGEGTAVRDALEALSQDAEGVGGITFKPSEELATVTHTLDELGREFKHRTPDRDFYVGVVYGPPPGMKIEFGRKAHVFDCSARRADKDLYRWLDQVRKRVTDRPLDRTP